MKDECINCGAWKGLHHYETNQCPRNGQEAPLGKLQEWDNTVYQEDNTTDLRAKIDEQAATIARLTELYRADYAGSPYDMTANVKYVKKKYDDNRKEIGQDTIISPIANPWLTTDTRNTLNYLAPGTVDFQRTVSVSW